MHWALCPADGETCRLSFLEFPERSERPPATVLLRPAHRTPSPWLHQQRVPTSVCTRSRHGERLHHPIAFPHGLSLCHFHSFKRHPAAYRKALRSSGDSQRTLLSSILSAMNSLARPGPLEQSGEEDPGPAGVPGSALWRNCVTVLWYFISHSCVFFLNMFNRVKWGLFMVTFISTFD